MEPFFDLIDYKDYFNGLKVDFSIIQNRMNKLNIDDFTFLKFFIILNHFFDWFIKSDVIESIKQDFFNKFNPYNKTDRCPSEFKTYLDNLKKIGFYRNDNYYLVRHICNKGKHFGDNLNNPKPTPTVRKYTNTLGANMLGESHIKSDKIQDEHKLYDAYQVCSELVYELEGFLNTNNLLS